MPAFRLATIVFLSGLAACSYQPVFNDDIASIDAAERDRYWLPETQQVTAGANKLLAEQARRGGRAVIEYVIDSNGRVTHVRVVESSPVAVWGEMAKNVATEYRYRPAPANSKRTPVMVTQEVIFKGDATD